MGIKRILYPTDFSPAAQAAAPVACSLARDYGAALVLLHVRQAPDVVVGEFGALPAGPLEAKGSLQARLRQMLPADFKGAVECEVADGDATAGILQAARDQRCDLIVLGTHGRSGLVRLLMGSVAEAVLRAAPCPVLTVKPAPEILRRPETEDAEPAVNRDELVTVCAVAQPTEAEVIHNALKAEGIRSFIQGGTQAGLVGTLGIPINIQVTAGDFNRASKFIQIREEHRR